MIFTIIWLFFLVLCSIATIQVREENKTHGMKHFIDHRMENDHD
jgi:hypothetical protein